MPTTYTNLHEIDLSLAVWLVHDTYDFIPQERAVSMTALLKPLRQIVLGARVDATNGIEDLSSRISLRMGHAIHDSIEAAWKTGYRKNLALLGIPESQIDKIRINPDPATLQPDEFPVYIEVRGTREIDGWTISGKMDMAINGRLKDIKSTSVYTYLLGRKDEDYRLQGSGYKWLHHDKITEDEIDIQFVFTDWQKALTFSRSDYPPTRVISYPVPLYTEEETENWIRSKLEDIVHYMDAPDEAIPRCTDEELWRSEPQWKYYADPTKTDGKSTKNFDNQIDANKHLAEKGKGVVKHIPGKVKACGYCKAFSVCKQKDEYVHD